MDLQQENLSQLGFKWIAQIATENMTKKAAWLRLDPLHGIARLAPVQV